MTEPKLFFIKQELLRVCAFHNEISISGQFYLSEWVLDGQVLPGHKIWLSTLEDGWFWIFFLQEAKLWNFTNAEGCWCGLANIWCSPACA